MTVPIIFFCQTQGCRDENIVGCLVLEETNPCLNDLKKPRSKKIMDSVKPFDDLRHL